MTRARTAGGVTLVDGHVHFYDVFPLQQFMEGAALNFARAARNAGIQDSPAPFLRAMVLLDGREGCPFQRLRGGVQGEMAQDGLSFRFRWDPTSGKPGTHRHPPFLVVAGRQIATRERLEVLALPTLHRFPAGRPLEETVERVLDAGVVPVIPWGFGKWWFARGRRVLGLLNSPLGSRVLLGDNGNRPRGLPRSRVFQVAAERGVPVLPGSDPLPLREHGSRAGSFGFVLDARLDGPRPAADLARRLRAYTVSPPAFGDRTGVTTTLRSNLKLRVRP